VARAVKEELKSVFGRSKYAMRTMSSTDLKVVMFLLSRMDSSERFARSVKEMMLIVCQLLGYTRCIVCCDLLVSFPGTSVSLYSIIASEQSYCGVGDYFALLAELRLHRTIDAHKLSLTFCTC
jgi:hypothetical protein